MAFTVSPAANISENFKVFAPGRYELTYEIPNMRTDMSVVPALRAGMDTTALTNALRQQGVDAVVESARYTESRDYRPITDNFTAALKETFGGRTGADDVQMFTMIFKVVVTIRGRAGVGTGVSGMGIAIAPLVLWLVVATIVAQIIAKVTNSENVILKTVKDIGSTAGGVVKDIISGAGEGAGDALKKAGVPLVVVALGAVAVLFLFKKTGGSINTSKFRI